MPRLKSLIQNLCLGATCGKRDFDLRLGGCRICASEIYFSNFWKIKKEKDWSDTQPDSAIQPKARGLLHMEREYLAHHIWISGLEHLTASKQPEVLGGLLDVPEGRTRSNQKDELTTWSTRRRPAKYSTPAGLGYEELGSLSDPGQRDCLYA